MAEVEEEEYIVNSDCPLCERNALLDECRQAFAEHFEHPDEGPFHFVVTPARLYLIGEHAQACRDRAVAMAVPYYMVAYGRRRRSCDRCSLMYDCTSKQMHKIEHPYSNQKLHEPIWVKIIRVVLAFPPYPIDMDIVIATSMPDGVNMGQEAAVELCILLLLRRLSAFLRPLFASFTTKECVELCLKGEKHYYSGALYNGVDLLVQATSKKNNFVLLETEPFSTGANAGISAVNIEFHGRKDIALILIDSGVRCPNLITRMNGKWERLNETARYVLAHNWKTVDRDSVTDVLKGWMLNIATHIMNEVERTDQAFTALLDNNYYLLGKILTASHISSRDLLEVSCPEVDRIVDLSLEVTGVYGSRIAGYGFGGFVITIVDRKCVRNLVEHIKANFNGNASFRECVPEDSVVVYSAANDR